MKIFFAVLLGALYLDPNRLDGSGLWLGWVGVSFVDICFCWEHLF